MERMVFVTEYGEGLALFTLRTFWLIENTSLALLKASFCVLLPSQLFNKNE